MSDQDEKASDTDGTFFDTTPEDSAKSTDGEEFVSQDDREQENIVVSKEPSLAPKKSQTAVKTDFDEFSRTKRTSRGQSQDSHKICIIGGPGCGKTAYLYTLGLLKQKKGIIVDGWKIGVFSIEYEEFFGQANTTEYRKNWIGTRFDDLKVFDMFPLTKEGAGESPKINLGVFDASGENFLNAIIPHKFKGIGGSPESVARVQELQTEISACSGFIFLIDAELAIPAILSERSKDEILPDQLLLHLNNFLGRSLNKNVGKLDIPIAFVLNKADVVQDDLPLFKDYMNVAESRGRSKQGLNDEAEGFIKKCFPDLHMLTGEFADEHKSFHTMSCWGQEPTYYRIIPGSEKKKVPGSKRSEYKGELLQVSVDAVNPIGIEEPLVYILNGIEKRINDLRKKKKEKILKWAAVIVMFMCLRLFLPWLTFGTGRIMESLTPAWASKMYLKSYDWALIKGIVPREKITIRAWGLYNKRKMGKSDLIALLRRAAMPVPIPETIEEIYLEMMAGEVRHALGTKDSENAISFLREIKKAVPQDHAQPLICEVLDGEAPKFFQTQNIEQQLSFLKDISDIAGSCQWTRNANRKLLLERVKASLKHGRPKDAIAMIRSQSSHNMPFISYLEHAEKAAVMAYIPGRGGLEPFYIDRYETTNLEYQRFMEEQNGPEPLYWNTQEYRRFSPNDDCPVIFVSLGQARVYAQKQGKRLPFAREWELAWGERNYPWGSKFDAEKANTRETGLLKAVSISSALVNNDKSPHGVYGLAGNVAEFTEGTFPDASNRKRVLVKGGNFLYPANGLNKKEVQKLLLTKSKETIGFRCVLDVLPNTDGGR